MNTQITTADSNFDPFKASGERAAAPARIIGQLLKFDRFGVWKAGQNNVKVEPGTSLIAYMPSLVQGWVKWVDNKPAVHDMRAVKDIRTAEEFATYDNTPAAREEKGDTDPAAWELDTKNLPRDPWQFTNYIVLSTPDGETIYTYATASKSGLTAIGKLSSAYGDYRKQYPNAVPVITLDAGSYDHATYGEIRIPILEITQWTEDVPEVLLHLGSLEEQEVTPPSDTLALPKPAATSRPVNTAPKAAAPKPALRPAPKPAAKAPPPKGKPGKNSRSIRF